MKNGCFCVWRATIALLLTAGAALADGFSYGVSAGDATDTSAILWTRADAPGIVVLTVATDAGLTDVVTQVTLTADAASDLTVRADVTDLAPATVYHYRFAYADQPGRQSAVGTFRTAPSAQQPSALRFVFSGDTNFKYAPFAVVGHAAQEDADFCIWFGDVVYTDVVAGGLGVAKTLDEYRGKYRQVLGDPNIQALLGRMAVWTGWDDHEVENDYVGTDPAIADQIAAAYQAFFEYMPIRRQGIPDDPFRTYRRMRYGRTAEFFFLDERQYRDDSAYDACNGNPDPFGFALRGLTLNPFCLDLMRQPRTLLGDAQREWLLAALKESDAPVKFVVNNVPITHIGVYPFDRWDGYDAERKQILEYIDANQITGVVFLTTDIHANAVNPDVCAYFRAHRPDYQLSNGVSVAEIIAGPFGNETLHFELIENAAELLRLGRSPIIDFLLAALERQIILKVRDLNGLTFINNDRVAYVVIDVNESGRLSLSYRGVRPEHAQKSEVTPEILHSGSLTDETPLPAPPCALPFFTGLLFAYAYASRLQRRVRAGEL